MEDNARGHSDVGLRFVTERDVFKDIVKGLADALPLSAFAKAWPVLNCLDSRHIMAHDVRCLIPGSFWPSSKLFFFDDLSIVSHVIAFFGRSFLNSLPIVGRDCVYPELFLRLD